MRNKKTKREKIMNNKKRISMIFALFAVMILAAVPLATKSRTAFYSFEIKLPDEVQATPGQDVTIEGGVLVSGMFWLHDFNLTATGIPYEYTISPNWFESVRILRSWNPVDGLFKTPDKFNITIHVPESAYGSYIVLVTGQEHRSYSQVQNSSYFVLNVGGAVEPQIEISDILVPETIDVNEPFTMTFTVSNKAPIDSATTISAILPEGWKADATSKTISIKAGESSSEKFIIVPTTSAGTVSLLVEYPFKNHVVNFTKEGPYLVPGGEAQGNETQSESIFSIIGNFVMSVKDYAEGSLSPVLIGLIVVLLIIIAWLSLGIYRTLSSKEGSGKDEPEKMEKDKDKPKAETKAIDSHMTTGSLSSVSVHEV
jgi:hypothetical protein